MQSSRVSILIVAAILIVSLVRCSPNSPGNSRATDLSSALPGTVPASPDSPNRECDLSCYAGITPGKTSLAEAVKQIQNLPQKPAGFDLIEVDHTFLWLPKLTTLKNRIHFTPQHIVDTMAIYEPDGSTLNEMVQKYGEPDMIILGSPGGGTPVEEFYVVYTTMGLAFGGEKDASEFLDQPAKRYIPEPDMLVNVVIYFIPGSRETVYDQDAWRGFVTERRSMSLWHGFGVSYYNILP